MNIQERFLFIKNEIFGGNQKAFAEAVGVAPSVIANVIGPRQGKPSFDVLEKICANANISPAWLISGYGSFLKNPADCVSSNTDIIQPEPKVAKEISSNIITNNSENNDIISQLVDTIRLQGEEIGRLKEQLKQAQIKKETNVLDVQDSSNVNVV